MVESGSKGAVVAVLLKVRKSLTCVRRDCAVEGPFGEEGDDIVVVLGGWLMGE